MTCVLVDIHAEMSEVEETWAELLTLVYCAKGPSTLILNMFFTVFQRKERGSSTKYIYINQRCRKIYECCMFRVYPVCLKDAGGMQGKGEVLLCTFPRCGCILNIIVICFVANVCLRIGGGGS